MMVLQETIGLYSQSICRNWDGEYDVEVTFNMETLFKGKATCIINEHNRLTFKDADGKSYEYAKRSISICP